MILHRYVLHIDLYSCMTYKDFMKIDHININLSKRFHTTHKFTLTYLHKNKEICLKTNKNPQLNSWFFYAFNTTKEKLLRKKYVWRRIKILS